MRFFALVPQRGAHSIATSDVDDVRELGRLAGTGAITPVIERRWPLADVAEALRVQGEFHARGKHVVIP